ncbi:MAG TPA: hypothetical protein VFT16_02210 [Candidatus Saccharimonadales bacterium]|nr:hypothetical protein [Candidatus Saccharimonadales bacterium]
MDKKSLHHSLTTLRRVKVWYLLLAFLSSSVICVLALRANNLQMVALRDDVYEADKNNGDVEGALQDLRAYVYSHMNTKLAGDSGVYPPIQLKYTYQRLQEAEKARTKAENDRIYTDAQVFCEQQNPSGFSGRGRVSCIEEYVKSHGVSERKIPDAMYKFDFVSPYWSPDLAGFSMLLSGVLFLLISLRIAAGYVIKRLVA